MAEIDDDFGELYSVVEVQASSAINGVRVRNDIGSSDNRMTAKPSSDDAFDSGPIGQRSIGDDSTKQMNEDDNGSDSEDDLNIVLNDDDCNGSEFPLTNNGSLKNDKEEDGDDYMAIKEFKYVRTHGSSLPSNAKTNAASSLSAKDDWNHNICNQQKGLDFGQSSHFRGTTNLAMISSGYGFSLPWYRSIFDINIDAFEEKPWRYPGVDITDFFNFGFNEESWKQYCNSLEQLRGQAFMQLGKSTYKSPKLYQAYEAGPKYDKGTEETMADKTDLVGSGISSRFSDCEERHLELPKGRAIQVENGIGERQPSFDLRLPRTQDSDVVIQITVQDLSEDASNASEKLGHTGSTQHETSGNGESHATYNIDVSDSNGGKGDESSVESLKENVKRVDRCSPETTASNPLTIGPDNSENKQSLDVDKNHHEEMHAFSSNGTAELFETVNESSESIGRNVLCADRCMVETELPLDEEDRLSLPSSCFDNDSEASKYSSNLDPETVSGPIKRSSMKSSTELRSSVTSYHKNSKRNYAKIMPVDTRKVSKYKNSVQEEPKNYLRRLESPARPKIRHGYDAFPISDSEDLYDRWKEKLQDIGYRDKDVAYYEESKHSHWYGGRKFAKNFFQNGRNYRKESQEFYGERDPYIRENWKRYDDEERDGYKCGRKRHFSFSGEQTGSRFKRKINNLQLRTLAKHNSKFLDYKHDVDFMQERHARSVSLIEWEKDDERPRIWRELRNSGRNRYDDASTLNLDNSWSREREDEHFKKADTYCVSHHSYRGSDRVRWNDSISLRNDVFDSRFVRRWNNPRPPRKDVFDLRFSETYRKELFSEEEKESSCFDRYSDAHEIEDSFIFPNDQVHYRRKRRCNWQSEVQPCNGEERAFRHQGDKFNGKGSSFSNKKDARHERNYSTNGLRHDEMHIDDIQLHRHRFNWARNGSNSQCIGRNSKTYRGEHEQTFLRYRDSADLIVGEGQSSGRYPKARHLKYNGRTQSMDLKIAEEPMIPMDFDGSPRHRATASNHPQIRRNYNNKMCRHQSPVAMQNDDLDVEDQRISGEPYNINRLERNCESHWSKVMAAIDNQQFLETLVKMEKRMERFKEPVIQKEVQDKCPQTDIVPTVETAEIRQHRPARKRRW
ncbi:hypothetical protein UlMin_009679 [Ulmus minor]